ncbi:MAG: hypothetical protein RLZZ69_2643, partial [Cyanobacteriota bacterium]
KLNMVDTVLAKIEQKIDSLEELTPHSLNETVEAIVKQEMSLNKDRDSNLQFRFDRFTQHSKRQEQKTNLAIKILTISNLVLFSTILALGYFCFSK